MSEEGNQNLSVAVVEPPAAAEPKVSSESRKSFGGFKKSKPRDPAAERLKKKNWCKWRRKYNFQSLCVLLFGVWIPCAMFFLTITFCLKRITLVLLNHPLETSLQLGFVLLIPFVNFKLWSLALKKDFRFSLIRGFFAGSALGTSLIISIFCASSLVYGCASLESQIGTEFGSGFTFIGILAMAALLTTLYQINKFRIARDFKSSRAQVVLFATIGLFVSVASLCATEAKSFYIRIAEKSAVSADRQERARGLNVLRSLNIERQLRMECTDDRATGIAGLFIPINSTTQRQLYFAITGKPFRDSNSGDLSAMSEDYLRRHVVGEPVKGLTLVRSLMSGALSPTTLTSTVNWTYVLKNESASMQEARAEIAMPEGTAVTGLTLWKNGDASDARIAVSVSEAGAGESSWVQANHECPAMLTPIGHGRFLLHCYPVHQEEELKIRLTMVVPLKAESASQAAIPIPRFVATNFGFEGEHMLRLKSPLAMSAHSKTLKHTVTAARQHMISGPLSMEELKGTEVGISTKLPAKMEQVAVFDMIATKLKEVEEKEKLKKKRAEEAAAFAAAQSELEEENGTPQQVVVMIDGSRGVRQQLEDVRRVLKPGEKAKRKFVTALKKGEVRKRYVVETIKPISVKPPRNLVVVLDGSAALAGRNADVVEALNSVPKGISTTVIVASEQQEKLLEPLVIGAGIKVVSSLKFEGGQDNLQAVVKAAELAGESDNGAVLWIHGPQPAFNREIYIMSQFFAAPAFYDYSIDSGETDTLEFFKNHSEIGPFSQIPKSTSMGKDIASFVSRWKTNRINYAVALAETTDKPSCRMASPKEAMELLALRANAYCEQLISERKAPRAAKIAATYGLVTPVSSAIVVAFATGDNLHLGERPANSADSFDQDSPTLQGATNGTIGPSGSDATYITGVNTAGTVRVNNLANLEALLNLISNSLECMGMLAGFGLFMHGIFQRSKYLAVPGLNYQLSGMQRVGIGLAIFFIAMSVPGTINWFVASARDANLFS